MSLNKPRLCCGNKVFVSVENFFNPLSAALNLLRDRFISNFSVHSSLPADPVRTDSVFLLVHSDPTWSAQRVDVEGIRPTKNPWKAGVKPWRVLV